MTRAGALTRAGFLALLDTMAKGWNEGDPDKVAACFAEHVYYCDPTRYLHTTREELREFFKPPEDGGQKTTWRRIIFDEEQQTGAAEYSYEGHYGYHGCVIAKVEDGLVTHWREWQHVSDQDWEEFVAGPGKLPAGVQTTSSEEGRGGRP